MPAPKLSDRTTPLLYATARLPCVQVTAPQQARPPYFLSAPCTALLHPWFFEDRIPERLGPRPSTDRTQDTSVQQLSQLIQPPKPTPSFAGFSRLEDLRRSYIVWRTFARVSLTADAANHTPAISLDLGRPTSSRRQLSQALRCYIARRIL